MLDSERVVVVATHGVNGWPHLMPLWYVLRDGEVWIYTYAGLEKPRNLERDPRATLLIETGHEYAELRGVMIEAEAEIEARPRGRLRGPRSSSRCAMPTGSNPSRATQADAAAPPRRPSASRSASVAKRTATWDHRKLGGAD